MKIKGLILIGLLTMFLSGCSKTPDDFYFEFPGTIECNENAFDDIKIESSTFPDEIEEGYLYSYVFDFGQYEFIFHNPDSEREKDEFVTLGAFGNRFINEDGAYRRTDIPEGYYLYEVTYIYASTCADADNEAEITLNLDKSFLFYSEDDYTEIEFREAHSDMFD